jgi:hypothetical protein
VLAEGGLMPKLHPHRDEGGSNDGGIDLLWDIDWV